MLPFLAAGGLALSLARSAAMSPVVRNTVFKTVGRWVGKDLRGGLQFAKPIRGLAALTAADAGKGFVEEAGEDVFNHVAGTDVNLPEVLPGTILGAETYRQVKGLADHYGNRGK